MAICSLNSNPQVFGGDDIRRSNIEIRREDDDSDIKLTKEQVAFFKVIIANEEKRSVRPARLINAMYSLIHDPDDTIATWAGIKKEDVPAFRDEISGFADTHGSATTLKYLIKEAS